MIDRFDRFDRGKIEPSVAIAIKNPTRVEGQPPPSFRSRKALDDARATLASVRPSVRPSVMSKREKFFEAIRKQKTDTVRWSLGAGGQSPSVRDEDGNTAIMICAAGNLHKALRMLLDHCRRSREREQMDLRDGEGDGRTALMMAAHNGHREACQELLDAGCNFKLKCERGKTAADYARAKGHAELAARIDRGGESEEEDTDEDDANEHDPDAPEGETSTQRSKRKKRELEAKERRGAGGKELEAAKTDAATKKDADANEAAEAAEAAVASRPKPTWPDVEKAIAGNLKELALDARSATGGLGTILPAGVAVDPALWHATSVNTLKISLGAALTTLPSEISRLSGLMTLILSDNALTSLPESIGELKRLKVLEAERNALTSVPSSLSDCACLEILRLGHNKLTSVKALAACNELVTLVLDDNELTTLDDLDVASKSRLVTLSAKKNAIERVPGNLGKCALLAELCLGDNAIENLPKSLGELKEKKVRALEFEGNPLRDPKIKKMMGKSANLVKELLTYVRKNGVEDGDGGGGGGRGGGGKKGKKGKNQAKREDSSDEDEDEDEAKRPAPEPEPAKPPPEKPPAAAAGGGGGDDDDSASEDEEELRERMSRMPKKERAKMERKIAEKKAEKAAKMAAKKREAADAAAAAQRAAAVDANALDADADDSEIDSDDEEALLARKQRLRAAAQGGGAYTLTPEQRAAAEKAEAARMAEAQAKKDAEEAAARRVLEEKEAEEKFAAMRLKEAAAGEVITWVFEKGSILRKPGGIPFKPGKKPGEPPTIQVVIPAMIVGRIIGKQGSTIRGIEERSKAKVSISEGKGGPGMSTLVVVGDDRASESVRMMVNNAIGGGKR